jgi:lactate dehydrogenase-like 2-hydroxyacid dehydrogenase
MQAEIDRRLPNGSYGKLLNAQDNPPTGAYRAILTRSPTIIPISLLEQLPNLEIIANCGVGYDNLALEYLQQRNIVATNTPGVLNDAVCELAVGLLLSLMRHIPAAEQYLRSGTWAKGSYPLTSSLAGKRVGIVGLGRIALDLVERLTPFKVHISYTGPNKKNVPYTYYSDIVSLAANCDVLIMLCPAGPSTTKIANAAVFHALGPTGYFINIARGSVLDEAALLHALENKLIAGAALDVFENEPHPNPEFFKLNNVLLTPHMASGTNETRIAMTNLTLDNLDAFFQQQPLLTPIPFDLETS